MSSLYAGVSSKVDLPFDRTLRFRGLRTILDASSRLLKRKPTGLRTNLEAQPILGSSRRVFGPYLKIKPKGPRTEYLTSSRRVFGPTPIIVSSLSRRSRVSVVSLSTALKFICVAATELVITFRLSWPAVLFFSWSPPVSLLTLEALRIVYC